MKNGEIINVNGKRAIFFHEEEGCSGCAFQNDSSCPEECEDGKYFELPNPWHTGLPTQYGEYVCLVHSMKCPHVKHKTILEWGEHSAERQDWFNREGGCDYEVIAWFLLPPCPYGKEWDIKNPLANLKKKRGKPSASPYPF